MASPTSYLVGWLAGISQWGLGQTRCLLATTHRQALTPSLCQRVALLAGVLCKEAGIRLLKAFGEAFTDFSGVEGLGRSGVGRGVVGWDGGMGRCDFVWGRR